MPAQRLPTDVRAAIATLVDFVDDDLERYTRVLGRFNVSVFRTIDMSDSEDSGSDSEEARPTR